MYFCLLRPTENFRLLFDTLHELVHAGKITILLPETVLIEFKKHEKEIGEKKIASYKGILNEILDHKTTIKLPTEQRHILAAAQDAIRKRAPFHHNKNSFCDALIMYGFKEILPSISVKGFVYFVSENTSDFCKSSNQSHPHEEFEKLFTDKVKFSINIALALNEIKPQAITPEVVEEVKTITPYLCPAGGEHVFDSENEAFLRSQYGGLTWQLLCKKCGARYDTGDYWD